MRFIFILSFFLSSLSVAAQTKGSDEILIFNRSGEQVDFSQLIEATTGKTHIFFGEMHGNKTAHLSELKLYQALHQLHGERLILGMEMFEMDVQPILDEYFADLINQRSFETEARIWNNYVEDYKPLVEYAKENDLRVIATNVPRRYANSVYHQGPEILHKMSRQAKKNFPKLPLKVITDSESYQAMAEMLPGHSADNFIASQALKDATMAWNIDRHMRKNDVIFHIHGAYHSINGEGIVLYLKKVPKENLLLITTIAHKEGEPLTAEMLSTADYTIVDFSPVEN